MSEQENPTTIYLKDYQVPTHLIDHVDLLFQLSENGTRVIATSEIRKNPASQTDGKTLRLHGEEMSLESVAIGGEPLSSEQFVVDDESLTVKNCPEAFTLKTEVTIAPENNTSLEGLYRSSKMFCTQCEAQGFRKITYFLDRPDVMAKYTVRLEADKEKYPVLLSNGNLIEQGRLEGNRHFAVWKDPFPKPSYLFAIVAGDLVDISDQYTTSSGRDVALKIYVEAKDKDKCDHAMKSLKSAMAWDEQRFGREYDLDIYNIVAVDDFNMGAMENKSLNIFNSKCVLARPDTATDLDFQRIEAVVAHEYFHNWTGNRITCRDWFQLSLKEGLTVFRDQEFSSDMGSRGVKRIDDVRMLRHHQFTEDAGPMAHPVRPQSFVEINNFYTVTIYEKGAEVVRMQANLLGPEGFRKATDLYFERHDGQAVTTDDFVACMADSSGKILTQFKRWYDYAGTPEVKVADAYDERKQTYTLTFKQSVPDTPGQTDKPPFHIPVRVALLGQTGDEMECKLEGAAGTEHVVELRQSDETVTFTEVAERPVPSLLRGFSAPVKLDFEASDEQLMFQMAHDSDGFSRWDAGQVLAQRCIAKMVDEAGDNGEMSVPDVLLQAFDKTLTKDSDDHALTAEVLTLPSLSYLGDFMEVIDIDGLYKARKAVKAKVGETFADLLTERYQVLHDAGPYELTSEAIGRRRLKNTMLSYLMATESNDAISLCVEQYQAQQNMTDVMASLSLLANSEAQERDTVLADFEKRWLNEPLVLDKWFQVQATASREGALDDVKRLLGHSKFEIKNPNRVRSLIGAFASGNPVRFHDKSGAGYEFLADKVLELDKLNPQVAARLLRGMASWKRYDYKRQTLIKSQLERIQAQELSKDVFEVVSKTLSA